MDLLNTCFETTNEVRALAYYSHLLPIISTLILGVFTYRFAINRTKAAVFLTFVSLLSLWLIADLVTWTSDNYYVVAAFWGPLDFVNILFYISILCFAVIDLDNKKTIPWYIVLITGITAIYPFLVTVAGLSVFEFDEPNCEMVGNDFLALYKLALEWFVIIFISFKAIVAAILSRTNTSELKRIGLSTFAIVGFLAIFSSAEYISTLTEVYEITLYALFALPVFVMIMTYTIFEQQTFKLQTDNLWTVRILFAIFILIGVSNLLLIDSHIELITTAASTIVTLGFGLMLLQSARKEVRQREQIEKLAKTLEKANERLKILDQMKSEFVSIASHQLRSPLTSIRGYASMILEGSYGNVPQKAREAVERIAESSAFMATSVEDYLNVSRIQAGNMKYEYSDFNLKDKVEKLVDDLRQQAVQKGLLLTFKSDLNYQGIVHADLGKTQQIVHNLINNALKYTPKGTVQVFVHDQKKPKRIFVQVTDSGIGMSQATIDKLFGKFERAQNANDVNATGTGLGLYIAKKMAEDMGGTVTAHSEGEGKGASFVLELPLQQ